MWLRFVHQLFYLKKKEPASTGAGRIRKESVIEDPQLALISANPLHREENSQWLPGGARHGLQMLRTTGALPRWPAGHLCSWSGPNEHWVWLNRSEEISE